MGVTFAWIFTSCKEVHCLCCTVNESRIYNDTIQTLLYEKFLQVSFTVNSVSEQINIESIGFRKVKKEKLLSVSFKSVLRLKECCKAVRIQ